MEKRYLYHSIEWAVTIAACVFLGYKIVTYEDYAALWATLGSMTWQHYLALMVCVALMPVNMSLEAWRWRTLLPMSWHEAHRQVYYSKLAGLITPWRLGEYPARALLRNEWKQTLSMGAVGSATMTIAIIAAGLTAMILEIGGIVGLGVLGILGDLGNLGGNGEWWMAVAAAMILLTTGLLLAPRMLRRWADVSHTLVLISIGQSLVRLACWCVQLALVLYALGAISNFKFQISNLPIYYLLITITPNVPIAEVGVRGAWAIMVFGSLNAGLAGVLLWVINTLLPCLIWPFLRRFR